MLHVKDRIILDLCNTVQLRHPLYTVYMYSQMIECSLVFAVSFAYHHIIKRIIHHL